MKPLLTISPGLGDGSKRYGVMCTTPQSMIDVGTTQNLAGTFASFHGCVVMCCDADCTAYGALHRKGQSICHFSTPADEYDEQVWLYWLQRAFVWAEKGGVVPLLCKVPEEVKA